MGKPYDATTKHLIERHPRDWLALAGLPLPDRAEALAVVDAELSSVTTAADKLIRVDTAPPYLAHAEFQAGRDAGLGWRVLVYNVLARWRHGLPVRSAVFLLRPEAALPDVTGLVREFLEPDARLEFAYRVVRVWELPAEAVLAGGLGTLPLAPVTAVRQAELPGVIDRMRQRLAAEVPPEEARELWTATQILMGLRYSGELVEQLLKGVQDMEESVTYQEIIRKGVDRGKAEGRAEGRADGERGLLILQGMEKFGPPDADSLARLAAIADSRTLESLGVRLLHVADWHELLGTKG